MADRYKCRGYGELTADHKSIHAFTKARQRNLQVLQVSALYIYRLKPLATVVTMN